MSTYRTLLLAIAVSFLWISFSTPRADASETYLYTGHTFTFCSFGCAGNAPANWATDYIVASITFASALAPNLALTDETASLTGWTLGDKLGFVSLSSAGGDVLHGDPADGIPGLALSTDSSGDPQLYAMVASDHGPAIFNLVPMPSDPSVGDIAAFDEFNFGASNEWDAGTGTTGSWVKASAVPEPSTLLLLGSGLVGLVSRRKRLS